MIDAGSLLKLELVKNSESSATIKRCMDAKTHGKCANIIVAVPDRLMIDLVAKKVTECEKEAKSYVIEGFPRTKVQALALEELGVVPDKVINVAPGVTH